MSIENSFLDKDSMGLRVDCPADAPEPPPPEFDSRVSGGVEAQLHVRRAGEGGEGFRGPSK